MGSDLGRQNVMPEVSSQEEIEQLSQKLKESHGPLLAEGTVALGEAH